MAQYPREITVKLRVERNGKLEIIGGDAFEVHELTDFTHANPLSGHNSIGVLVSNPTCFVIGGKMYCYP